MISAGKHDHDVGVAVHDLAEGQHGGVAPHLEGVVYDRAYVVHRHVGGVVQNSATETSGQGLARQHSPL